MVEDQRPDDQRRKSYGAPPTTPLSYKSPSNPDQNSPKSNYDSWREWIRLGVEIAALLGLVCYIHWTKVQAMANEHAANAATIAAKAARDANIIARESLETSERAYVSIQDLKVVDFRIGGKPYLFCNLRNTGRRPATGITMIHPMGFGPPYKPGGPVAHGAFMSPAPTDTGDVLGPGEVTPMTRPVRPPTFRPPTNWPKFAPFDIGEIIKGNESLQLTVAVSYWDGFGRARMSWRILQYQASFRGFIMEGSHED